MRGQGAGRRALGSRGSGNPGIQVFGFLGLLALGTSRGSFPVTQGSVDTTVVIRANTSTLAFEPDRISVKNGKRVRIRFINQGTLPHNIVFLKHVEDLDSLAAAAMRPTATGYVPLSLKDKMLAWTSLASGMDTVEVIFVVPPPGEYTFVCLMSGHSNNMLGTLRSLK